MRTILRFQEIWEHKCAERLQRFSFDLKKSRKISKRFFLSNICVLKFQCSLIISWKFTINFPLSTVFLERIGFLKKVSHAIKRARENIKLLFHWNFFLPIRSTLPSVFKEVKVSIKQIHFDQIKHFYENIQSLIEFDLDDITTCWEIFYLCVRWKIFIVWRERCEKKSSSSILIYNANLLIQYLLSS